MGPVSTGRIGARGTALGLRFCVIS
jgi:hypothetical protein